MATIVRERDFSRHAPVRTDDFKAGRGPLPLCVGIVGHIDIREADVPELAAKVSGIFKHLLETYPSTPIVVITALAAGADRIGAQVAREFGIPLIVPMPLEQAEYENDFDDAQTDEFRGLLRDSQSYFFVGYDQRNNATSVMGPGPARDLQYARAGEYVARNSQILIALWNGKETDSVGGTAQIVKFKRGEVCKGFTPCRGPIDPAEPYEIYHILTPRRDDPDVAGGEPFRQFDEPRGKAKVIVGEIHRNIDRFNREAPFRSNTKLSSRWIREAADELAQRHRSWTFWTGLVILGLAFLAASAYELYAHLNKSHDVWLAEVSLGISAGALIVFSTARRRRDQDRYQDYRVICEGLRIQEHLQSARVIDCNESIADYYVRQHLGEMDWVRSAIRAGNVLSAAVPRAIDLGQRKRELELLRSEWIHRQFSYFGHRIQHYESVLRVLSLARNVALGCSLMSLAVGIFINKPDEVVRWPIIASAMFAVTYGLLQAFIHMQAYEGQAKHYHLMRAAYERADRALKEVVSREPFTENDYEDRQHILKDLATQALAEHAAWTILRREHPIEYVAR